MYKHLDRECLGSRLRQYLREKRVTDPKAIDLLERMLVVNPANRASITEVAQHPYLNDPEVPACRREDLPRI